MLSVVGLNSKIENYFACSIGDPKYQTMIRDAKDEISQIIKEIILSAKNNKTTVTIDERCKHDSFYLTLKIKIEWVKLGLEQVGAENVKFAPIKFTLNDKVAMQVCSIDLRFSNLKTSKLLTELV